MSRKKCAKTDAGSSPSAVSSLTTEEMKSIIPAFIWEKQQDTLKRAGFSPPEHMQFTTSSAATWSENDVCGDTNYDDLLQCLDDETFWIDEEDSQKNGLDYFHGQAPEQGSSSTLAQETLKPSTTQSPPSMSKLTLLGEEDCKDIIPTKNSASSPTLPKRFFTQEDEMPLDDFSSDGDDDGDD
jgi:hypothetical protein